MSKSELSSPIAFDIRFINRRQCLARLTQAASRNYIIAKIPQYLQWSICPYKQMQWLLKSCWFLRPCPTFATAPIVTALHLITSLYLTLGYWQAPKLTQQPLWTVFKQVWVVSRSPDAVFVWQRILEIYNYILIEPDWVRFPCGSSFLLTSSKQGMWQP